MVAILRNIADDDRFTNFITIIIILAGVLVGMQTYPSIEAQMGSSLELLNRIVLWIFVAEVVIKMGAEGSKPWRYFLDAWNVFDFAIVAAAFLPFGGESVAVLRLIRLLRVLRLVTAIPKLQLLVGALLKSIPSMGWVSILLFLLFYVYAVAGVIFWGENDPLHFVDLETSLLTLFRVVTLEDWTDIMYIQMFGCANYPLEMNQETLCTNSSGSMVGGAFFFVSFVLIGTMVILNLFIGVIMNGMDEAKRENEEAELAATLGHEPTAEDELVILESKVHKMEEALAEITHLIKDIKDKQQ